MKVKIEIDPTLNEPHAQLNIPKLTPSLETIVKILENEGQKTSLTGTKDGKIYLLDPQTVEIIRAEGRDLILYNREKEAFVVTKPLYELQTFLPDDFVRVSKSAIVNIHFIDHVRASFNGTMEMVMKNGVETIITRSYRSAFKKRLGV